MEAIDPNLGNEPSTGLRIAASLYEGGDLLIITDAQAKVRGLARVAPVAAYGRATPDDIVRGVAQTLLHTDRSAGRSWIGFAARGDGPPYRAELRNHRGNLICHAP